MTNPAMRWPNDEKDRLVGFLSLLLKIDQRENPELYENNEETEPIEIVEVQGSE